MKDFLKSSVTELTDETFAQVHNRANTSSFSKKKWGS